MSPTEFMSISHEFAPKWIQQTTFDYKLSFVQLKTLCNKPLPELILTKSYLLMWGQKAAIS